VKIKILAIGKTKQDFVLLGLEKYRKRLRKYGGVEWLELADVKHAGSLPQEERKTREGAKLLDKIQRPDTVVLLDESGRSFTSTGFADQLTAWERQGSNSLVFCIGGAYGFSDEVYQRAQFQLSLSKLTFSHQMVRLFFAEQLYRAFTIRNNESYHHA